MPNENDFLKAYGYPEDVMERDLLCQRPFSENLFISSDYVTVMGIDANGNFRGLPLLIYGPRVANASNKLVKEVHLSLFQTEVVEAVKEATKVPLMSVEKDILLTWHFDDASQRIKIIVSYSNLRNPYYHTQSSADGKRPLVLMLTAEILRACCGKLEPETLDNIRGNLRASFDQKCYMGVGYIKEPMLCC
jgi:hypothetical protein